MIDRYISVFVLTLVFTFSLTCCFALRGQANNLYYVDSITDGDSFTVLQGKKRIKVRLACIDAPEISQSPFGLNSKHALQTLLPIGSQVALRTLVIDRYGRNVAEVINWTVNIGQRLVQRGHAFVYWKCISRCDRQIYARVETNARLKGEGVWSFPGGLQRPWIFRRSVPIKNISASKEVAIDKSRYRCRDLNLRSEAQYLLSKGHSYLDRDGDGEACELLR